MKKTVGGIHHVTAISGPAHENYKFYTQVLGLRLVKKTVNFDDPSVYHLYYGDRSGSPGTLMTFFPYGGRSARKGTGQVDASSYPVRNLDSWEERLREWGVELKRSEILGTPVLRFQDPHGMNLELYQSTEAANELGPIGGATLRLQKTDPTRKLLELLGFELEVSQDGRTRMRLQNGDFIDLVSDSAAPASGGAGSVHHIALRVSDDDEQLWWKQHLRENGYQVSPVMDRDYFHSIYFRGPGGVLFELATDPPGMLIDEDLDHLGEKLMLPTQYESYRPRIEGMLEPLESPYQFLKLEGEGATVVALHGTGGDEHDLLNLVKQVAPGQPVLSLRGNAPENGMNRFFRRLRPGLFDQGDLRRRSQQLAEFLETQAAPRLAVGYSNGANFAAATLMSYPTSFERAVLFRPMLGWEPPASADLSGVSVLLLVGRRDRVVPPELGQALADSLRELGAEVQLEMVDSDHQLIAQDLELASQWLAQKQAVKV